MHIRHCILQASNQLRQDCLCQRDGHAKPVFGNEASLSQHSGRLLELLQNRRCIALQCDSGFCQSQTSAASVKQSSLIKSLQLFDRNADSGLCHIQLFSG